MTKTQKQFLNDTKIKFIDNGNKWFVNKWTKKTNLHQRSEEKMSASLSKINDKRLEENGDLVDTWNVCVHNHRYI